MRIAYASPLPDPVDERFVRAPIACGLLAAYVAAHRGEADCHDVVRAEELLAAPSVAATVDRMLASDPQIVALSVYIWNAAPVAAVIAELRRRRTGALLVLGGPEVQFTPEIALRRFAPDFVCTGEGERAFLGLVEHIAARGRVPVALPGIASAAGLGAPAPLVASLDDISSPYRTGFIDVPSSGWVDLETTRGCPFTCSFCLYGKNLDKRRFHSIGRVRDDLAWLLERGATDVYFLDPTFNLPHARCREILDLLAELNRDRAAHVYVEARAEAVDEDMADRLLEAGVRSVEVGLQAVDAATLDLMRRSLGRKSFVAGCRRLRERGISVDIGIIMGLPGDTEETIRRTIAFATSEPLGEISAYRLRVLPGSGYWGQAAQLELEHADEPPYFVRRTPHLSPVALDRIEAEVQEVLEPHNRAYRALIDARRPLRTTKLAKAMKSKKAMKEPRERFAA